MITVNMHEAKTRLSELVTHGLTVLTSDENIARYPGVRTLW